MNPFKPNITLSIEELENPFQPVIGEGGKNSGKPLEDYITNLKYNYDYDNYQNEVIKNKKAPVVQVKDYKGNDLELNRRQLINFNAQRTYRDKNRDKYNAKAREYYKKLVSNKSKKDNLLETMKVINKNYRLNKKLADFEKQKSQPVGDEKFERKVNKLLNEAWEARKKTQGIDKKKGAPTKQQKKDKEEFFKSKEERASVIEKEYQRIKNSNDEKRNSDPDLKNKPNLTKKPLFQTNEDQEWRQLNNKNEPFTISEVNYEGLEVAPSNSKKPDEDKYQNLLALKKYYEDVIRKWDKSIKKSEKAKPATTPVAQAKQQEQLKSKFQQRQEIIEKLKKVEAGIAEYRDKLKEGIKNPDPQYIKKLYTEKQRLTEKANSLS
jgi:hypothetical protein